MKLFKKSIITSASVSLLSTVILTSCLTRQPDRVLAQWSQPNTIQYGSFDPYSLSIIEMNTDSWGHTYQIFVGRGTHAPAYGHYVQFPFHPYSDGLETYIRNCKVEWAADGVTLISESGHRLFIPKAMFIGGR